MASFGPPSRRRMCRVADPAFNVARTIELAREADTHGASLALFPELGLSSYAIDDLLHQEALLDAVDAALVELVEASCGIHPLIVVGAPLRHRGRLYNCGVAILRGRVLAVTPKVYLPNYREFYEQRHFSSGAFVADEEIEIAGQIAPFGSDTILEATDFRGLAIHMEICEDVWVPIPPSARAALAGATVLLNLSASNAIVGKSDYRETSLRGAFGALPCSLSLFGGGAGRVDDGSRLGRRSADL